MSVLLVEDSPGDVRLTQEAFRDADVSIGLHVTSDGVEAMAFLRHQGPYASAPRPDLILLDLNQHRLGPSLPKMDGREVLAFIKADDNLRNLLPYQARGIASVRGPGEQHQRFLADQG